MGVTEGLLGLVALACAWLAWEVRRLVAVLSRRWHPVATLPKGGKSGVERTNY
jgi:hypothetical protein